MYSLLQTVKERDGPQNELSQFMRYVSLGQLSRGIALFPNQEGVLSLLTRGSVIYVCMFCGGGGGGETRDSLLF